MYHLQSSCITQLWGQDAPFWISVRFHWPMQGPQAFASTVPPTFSKMSRSPSRAMVARICSEPGVMVKGTCQCTRH